MHEMRDLERISRSRILSTNTKLDNKYEKVLETKIHTKNNEISIEEPHIHLKSTINDEQISTIKKFIERFFKTPNSPELDYIAKIIWWNEELLDELTENIKDDKQKKFAKTIARTAMISHENINGHAHTILSPIYGDINAMYTIIYIFIIMLLRPQLLSLLVKYPRDYFFNCVAHEAFAMLNEEHVWSEYKEYQSVMSVKNDIRRIRKRDERYRRAYELIEYLQRLKGFDYSEAQKLFFTDPPKPIILKNKKNKKETTIIRSSMIDILYDIIFCLGKGLKIGDVKGYIEEVLNGDAQDFINNNPDYEVIGASSNPRYPEEVVFFSSYFCVFPKEECFEFCAYAPTGYTDASAQEILKEMISSMDFSIRLYNTALEDEVVKNFLSGKYMLMYLDNYKKVLVFDSEEYYEKFMNKLLYGDLSRYETLHYLKLDVLKTLRPIRDP